MNFFPKIFLYENRLKHATLHIILLFVLAFGAQAVNAEETAFFVLDFDVRQVSRCGLDGDCQTEFPSGLDTVSDIAVIFDPSTGEGKPIVLGQLIGSPAVEIEAGNHQFMQGVVNPIRIAAGVEGDAFFVLDFDTREVLRCGLDGDCQTEFPSGLDTVSDIAVIVDPRTGEGKPIVLGQLIGSPAVEIEAGNHQFMQGVVNPIRIAAGVEGDAFFVLNFDTREVLRCGLDGDCQTEFPSGLDTVSDIAVIVDPRTGEGKPIVLGQLIGSPAVEIEAGIHQFMQGVVNPVSIASRGLTSEIVDTEPERGDGIPPSVRLTGLTDNADIPGFPGNTVMLVTAQDVSGLSKIEVISPVNVTVDVPDPNDTKDPVVITATRIDDLKSAEFRLRVEDVTGEFNDNFTGVFPEDRGIPVCRLMGETFIEGKKSIHIQVGDTPPRFSSGLLEIRLVKARNATVDIFDPRPGFPTFPPGVLPDDLIGIRRALGVIATAVNQNKPANVKLVVIDRKHIFKICAFDIIGTTVNGLVDFKPDKSSYGFTGDTVGCPAGSIGKFSFNAILTNTKSDKPLSNLAIEVDVLTQGNYLLTSAGLIEQGGAFALPINPELRKGASVVVPFTVCLTEKKPFRLLVNVVDMD